MVSQHIIKETDMQREGSSYRGHTLIDLECIPIPPMAIDKKPIREWKIVASVQDSFQLLKKPMNGIKNESE